MDVRLRSAFLQRATGMDRLSSAPSYAERQRELRRHFNAVLDILVANAEENLETALNRLESRRNERWTTDERLRWRAELGRRRLQNLQRLARYQRRGRFPINGHVRGRAVPIFVDSNDTACAVGHLMRESGWGEQVASIESDHNLVYVSDVSDGPIVDWVATSGLTQEEAAIIQPGYPYDPPASEASLQNLFAGGSLQKGSLRYENFKLWGALPFAGSVNLNAGVSSHYGGFSEHVPFYHPTYPHVLFIGAQSIGDFIRANSESSAYEEAGLFFAYDVVSTESNLGISKVKLEMDLHQNQNSAPGQASLSVQASVSVQLASPNYINLIASNDSRVHQSGTINLTTPVKRVTVFNSMVASEGAIINSYIQEFEVVPVPEPQTQLFILVGAALVYTGLIRTPRFRRT